MATATGNEREEVLATTPDALREQALERLKKRRDFKAHLLVYALVNVAVWGIWAVVAASTHSWWPWPVFVTLFWGIGLAMNAWDVDLLASRSTEDELQQEMEHLCGGE